MINYGIQHLPAEEILRIQNGLNKKLLSGEITVQQLELFSNGQNPFEFPGIVTLGNYNSADEIKDAILQAGGNVSDCCNKLMTQPGFVLTDMEKDVRPIKVSDADLGFTQEVTREQIYNRAVSVFGYSICPPEFGPQLRIQYMNQVCDETLEVAMEPILDSDGNANIFQVERDGYEFWLSALKVNPGDICKRGRLWVFLQYCD